MTVSRVSLRHPVTGDMWECPAGAVAIWRGKGWQDANEPHESTEAPGDGAEETENEPAVGGDESTAASRRSRKGSK